MSIALVLLGCQSYERGLAVICDAPLHSPPDPPHAIVSQITVFVDDNVDNERARRFYQALGDVVSGERADRLRKEARAHGTADCPLADRLESDWIQTLHARAEAARAALAELVRGQPEAFGHWLTSVEVERATIESDAATKPQVGPFRVDLEQRTYRALLGSKPHTCAYAGTFTGELDGRWEAAVPTARPTDGSLTVESCSARAPADDGGVAADPGRLKLERMEVVGSIRRGAVQEAFRVQRADIIRCYQTRLVAQPKLSGLVETMFVISSAGSVTTQQTVVTPDQALAACVREAIGGWSFARPDADSVRVTARLRFSRSIE